MIRTEGEIVTDIYKYVAGSPLAVVVNGEIIKSRNRPLNSDKEDIVIKPLANQPGQTQVTIVNCNIYVPDEIDNGQYEKNGARCDELERLSATLFEVFHLSGARVILDSQHTYQVENARAHVINNRLLYTVINE